MTAGLLQLNFIGPQDKYLTGNPQMTYFKNVFKSHSNFAKELKILQFDSSVKLGSVHSCTIKDYGDLLSDLYLYIELPQLVSSNNNENWAGYVNGVGYSIIKSVSFDIGGQTIDKFDSNWMDIYNEIYNQRTDSLVGKFNTDITLQENSGVQRLYIPLQFWFNKNNGNALPLIALKYHEIKVNVEFRNLNEIVKSDISTYSPQTPVIKSHIIANYIYLDSKEQKFFTNNKHDYLIEQTQILTEEEIFSTTQKKKIQLDLVHPIKTIHWVIVNNINNNQNMKTGNNWLTYTSTDCLNSETFASAKITINGQDRIPLMHASYYRDVVPYEIQTYFPRKYIYTYSFSLYPGQYQPSGSCNYSRIQNNASHLEITFNNINSVGGATNGRIKTYAVNYNILSIDKGMGGVLFTN